MWCVNLIHNILFDISKHHSSTTNNFCTSWFNVGLMSLFLQWNMALRRFLYTIERLGMVFRPWRSIFQCSSLWKTGQGSPHNPKGDKEASEIWSVQRALRSLYSPLTMHCFINVLMSKYMITLTVIWRMIKASLKHVSVAIVLRFVHKTLTDWLCHPTWVVIRHGLPYAFLMCHCGAHLLIMRIGICGFTQHSVSGIFGHVSYVFQLSWFGLLTHPYDSHTRVHDSYYSSSCASKPASICI